MNKLLVKADEQGNKKVYLNDVELDNVIEITTEINPTNTTTKVTLAFWDDDQVEIKLYEELAK